MSDLQSKLAALKAKVGGQSSLSQVADLVTVSEAEGDRVVAEAVQATKEYLQAHPVRVEPAPAEPVPAKKGRKPKYETRPLLSHEITPLITAALLQGARGEKTGDWIWLWDLGSGTPLGPQLLAEGFWWSKSKKAWTNGVIKNFRKGYIPKRINQIRDKFGSQEIK